MEIWQKRSNFGALSSTDTNECRRKCDFGKSTGLDNRKDMENKGKTEIRNHFQVHLNNWIDAISNPEAITALADLSGE